MIVLVGAGRHAVEVLAMLIAAGRGDDVRAMVEENCARVGERVAGVEVRDVRELENWRSEDLELVGAIGSPKRRPLLARLEREGFRFTTVVHPRAAVGPRVELEPGAVVGAGSVLTTDIRLEAHALVNVACSLSHDVVVGRCATIAPGVILCGAVQVAEGAYLGAGVVVRDRVRIGSGTLVGAGAVVVRDLPPGVLATGVPAQVRRPVDLQSEKFGFI